MIEATARRMAAREPAIIRLQAAIKKVIRMGTRPMFISFKAFFDVDKRKDMTKIKQEYSANSSEFEKIPDTACPVPCCGKRGLRVTRV